MPTVEIIPALSHSQLMIENAIRKLDGRPELKPFSNNEELDALLDKAKAEAGRPIQVEDYRKRPNDLAYWPMAAPRTYVYGW